MFISQAERTHARLRPHVAVAGNADTASTAAASLRTAGNRTMTLPCPHRCRLHQGRAAKEVATAAVWVTSTE